jgi:methanogen homocitrate synthase
MTKLRELPEMPMLGQPYFSDKKWVSPVNFEVATPEMSKSIYIHDVTLRDGEQTCGLNWTEQERIGIALALNDLGVKRIEIGMPVVSEDIIRATKKLMEMDLRADIVTFARARKEDIDLSVECGVKHIVVEHAVNPYTCYYAYDVDTERLIKRLVDHIKYAKDCGLKTTFMGWDVTRASLDYVKKVYAAVVEQAEPEAVVYTDSFGVASPLAIYKAISELKKELGVPVEFHVHNEFGMAMGSVLAAVYAGVDGIHSSINGLGERTGNVATEEVAAALEILLNVPTGVDISKIDKITKLVEGITGITIPPNKPVTGKRLFWLESGVVVHAKEKLERSGIPSAMTPYLPDLVGREPIQIVLGGSSGKASVQYYLDQLGVEVSEEQLDTLVERIKDKGREKRDVLTKEEFDAILKGVLA